MRGRFGGPVSFFGDGLMNMLARKAEHASYPFQSHDQWFLTEDIRWGKFEVGTDTKALNGKVNREDMWREAAKDLGVAAGDIPASTSRGKETFFDGKVFDPDDPHAYLASLAIKKLAA